MKHKIILGLMLALLIPQLALAQVSFRRESGQDSMTFDMIPGQELTHSIYAMNLSDEVKTVSLFATDGVITPTGTFTSTSKYDKQTHTGKWIKFEEPMITLEPKSEKLVKFTISVSDDATPGSYAGGISIEPVNPAVTLKLTGAITTTRVVVPLYVNIKGVKITKFALDSLTHQYNHGHVFSFNMRNEGNTILKAQGEIEIRNITGETFNLPVSDITLLKDSAQNTTVNWDSMPLWGIFTATAKLKVTEFDIANNTYSLVENVEKSVTFTVIPWTIILWVAGLVILLLAVVIVRKIMAKSYLKKCVSYQVVEGETLMSIAKKAGADWKKVAKINKIKAPYEVTKGQKILVPPKKK
jgi:LysM repeat protein